MEKKHGKIEIYNITNKRGRKLSLFNCLNTMTPLNKISKRIVQGILIVVLILLLLHSCESCKGRIIEGLGGYTEKTYKETIDTLEVRRDSIFYKYDSLKIIVDKIVEPKVLIKYIPTEVKTTSSSTKGKLNQQPEPAPIDSVYAYYQPISDTLIEGKITTIVNIGNSKIVAQNLEYKPKFPIIVKEYITIEKTKETTIANKPKNRVGIGLGAASNNTIGATGVFQTKKLWQYQAGYSWGNQNLNPVNSQVGIIEVKIIKLF